MQTPINSGTATAAQIDLSAIVSTSATKLLYNLIVDDTATPYTGDLKTGIQACANGTEAYWSGGSRTPGGGANYAARVVKDQSCKGCDPNMFAAKTGERGLPCADAGACLPRWCT